MLFNAQEIRRLKGCRGKVCRHYLLEKQKRPSLLFLRAFFQVVISSCTRTVSVCKRYTRSCARDLSFSGKLNKRRRSLADGDAVVRVCVCTRVRFVRSFPLLSLFSVFGNERQPCDPLALVHSILPSFSLLSPTRVFLILCFCEVWSNVFIQSEHFNSMAEMFCREALKDFLPSQRSRLILSL